MMNKSEIEYCDFSWNPVTGCWTGCEYCYAAKQAKRFSGDVRINRGSGQLQRELPAALSRPEDKPIPHCSDCEHHRATKRHYNERHGKIIMNHFCVNGDGERKVIPGRYVRTSPPWCPLRGEEIER